ncbi:MAG: FtsW/RodA/SpoVE family cell cycle protein, partial [Candidatus Electryoneaceae bacterium]|nr:FtsW/RodA/SpoVE family cell cycle protein [Candidatus Electryoneaceae bacterium]
LFVALTGLPFIGLVLLQPDLGTSTVFVVLALALLVWHGLPLKIFIMMMLPLLSMIISIKPWIVLPLIFVSFLWLWRARVIWVGLILLIILCVAGSVIAPMAWDQLKPYQQKRLTIFLDPSADPLCAGYQVIQSKVAVGSGGITGQGFLQGTQTQLRFLPEQHTDFIFALAGEEFGFVGVLIIILLLLIYGWRGYLAAMRTKSTFMGAVAAGMTTLILYHAIVNIGMAIGILPVTGLPLSFISYGRSFLITCMVGTGMILSAGLHRRE